MKKEQTTTQDQNATAESANAKAEKKFRFTPIRWGCQAVETVGYGIGTVIGTVSRIPLALSLGLAAGFKSEIVKKS